MSWTGGVGARGSGSTGAGDLGERVETRSDAGGQGADVDWGGQAVEDVAFDLVARARASRVRA